MTDSADIPLGNAFSVPVLALPLSGLSHCSPLPCWACAHSSILYDIPSLTWSNLGGFGSVPRVAIPRPPPAEDINTTLASKCRFPLAKHHLSSLDSSRYVTPSKRLRFDGKPPATTSHFSRPFPCGNASSPRTPPEHSLLLLLFTARIFSFSPFRAFFRQDTASIFPIVASCGV